MTSREKTVFGISDQVLHEPASTVTERRLEARRQINDITYALIRCASVSRKELGINPVFS